jgi:hypothetical protein
MSIREQWQQDEQDATRQVPCNGIPSHLMRGDQEGSASGGRRRGAWGRSGVWVGLVVMVGGLCGAVEGRAGFVLPHAPARVLTKRHAFVPPPPVPTTPPPRRSDPKPDPDLPPGVGYVLDTPISPIPLPPPRLALDGVIDMPNKDATTGGTPGTHAHSSQTLYHRYSI